MSLKRRESMTQSCSGGVGGGGGLRVAADDPHLVSLGGGRLSTAVTIHQLPVGDTTIGSSVDCSIVLCGSGVQALHCTLHRTDSGSVSIHAQRDARVLLDGKRISGGGGGDQLAGGTPLSQGVMITIGKSNYLRFNHPAEAELMRSTIGSNERISMPPIDFAHDSTSSGSGSSSTDGSPCEMLRSGHGDSPTPPLSASATMTKSPAFGSANAQNMNNFHSPKVFAADSATMNAPAKDVLGAKFTNFTKNLTQMFGKNEKNAAAAGQQNQQRKTSNDAKQSNVTVSTAVATAHAQAVVTSPKVPQQFSACYDRYPKPGSYGSLQVFPMNNVNTEMNTEQTAPQPMVPSATSMSTSAGTGGGLTELQRQRAQIERMQEEQISKMEHERLEEILKMCADFERQHESTSSTGLQTSTVQSSPIVQNRIKTNGSLPREKKPSPTNGHGSAGAAAAAAAADAEPSLFFPSTPTGASSDAYTTAKPPSRSGYENVHIGTGRQVHVDSTGCSTGSGLPSPPNGYENVTGGPPPSPARKPIGYVPQSPRTKIKTCASPKRESSQQQQQQQLMSMSMHATSASQRAEYDALVQSFEEKLRLEIQMLRENRSTAAQATPQAARTAAEQPEPVYGTLEKRPSKNVNNLTVNIAASRGEQLRAERVQVLQRVRELRARIAELQQQDEEMMRGLDMEKALVTAELTTERTHLQNLQRNIATLQSKIQRIETQRTWNRTMQEQQQHKLKLTIEHKQAEVEHLGSLLAQHGNDESVRSDLNATMDDLETHSKCYEDLEFQCFEEEAEWSAHHEELLNDLRTLRKMSVDKERQIGQLQAQCAEAAAEAAQNSCSGTAAAATATAAHSPSVERELRAQLGMLKQQRDRLRSLDVQLFELTGQPQQPATNSESDDEDDEDEDSVLLSKTGRLPAHAQPLMSQSLFGSQEILAASRQTIAQQQRADLDLMSRSVNENMFLRHHNIESRTPFTSTPKRRGDSDGSGSVEVPLRSVDISEDITRLSQTGHEQLRRAELQQQQLLDDGDDDEDTEGSAESATGNPMTALKYNLSPPFQHKKSASAAQPPLTPTSAPVDLRSARAQKASTLNLSIESDDFEVNPLERRVPSQDDIDRICKITLDAPISTQGASYKVIESIKEIERNRQLLLKQQGSHVIEHERQKMHELKKKSHDEARAQYMQQSQTSAAMAAAAVAAAAMPNGSSGDAVDERDSYARKDRSLETVQQPNGATAASEELKLNPVATGNNNAQPQQQRHSAGSGHAIIAPNGNNDPHSGGGGGGAINNNKSPASETGTSPHRHSQPDFERVRPLSDANSELSYDMLAEKPFKSTTDIRLSAGRLHENGNGGQQPQQHYQHYQQQQQQQQPNHQQHGHSAQYYQQQQQRHSQTSHDSNGSGNGTDGTEDQFQQQTCTQQQHRSLVAGSKRNLPKHQRPLTRYLPIMSLDLDLRQHIVSAGHQVMLCPHVLLDAHSCRGYLHKLGATFHGWSRRWFLFDRQKMALIYFSDKSERKPRGGAYFSTIDEVYLDHMNTSKSGRPYCTFIVKTKKRSYHLQAASDAAARIWIDAIITGAQGNIDY